MGDFWTLARRFSSEAERDRLFGHESAETAKRDNTGAQKCWRHFLKGRVMLGAGDLFNLNNILNGFGYGRWFGLQTFCELNGGLDDE